MILNQLVSFPKSLPQKSILSKVVECNY